MYRHSYNITIVYELWNCEFLKQIGVIFSQATRSLEKWISGKM